MEMVSRREALKKMVGAGAALLTGGLCAGAVQAPSKQLAPKLIVNGVTSLWLPGLGPLDANKGVTITGLQPLRPCGAYLYAESPKMWLHIPEATGVVYFGEACVVLGKHFMLAKQGDQPAPIPVGVIYNRSGKQQIWITLHDMRAAVWGEFEVKRLHIQSPRARIKCVDFWLQVRKLEIHPAGSQG